MRRFSTQRRERVTRTTSIKKSVECGRSQVCSARFHHPSPRILVRIATTPPEWNKNNLAETAESRLVYMKDTIINSSVNQSRRTGAQNTKNQKRSQPYSRYVKDDNEFSLSVQHEHLKHYAAEQSPSMLSVPVSMFSNLKKSSELHKSKPRALQQHCTLERKFDRLSKELSHTTVRIKWRESRTGTHSIQISRQPKKQVGHLHQINVL